METTRLTRLSIGALAAGCLLGAGSAMASSTTTGSLAVSATVLKSCVIGSGTLAIEPLFAILTAYTWLGAEVVSATISLVLFGEAASTFPTTEVN